MKIYLYVYIDFEYNVFNPSFLGGGVLALGSGLLGRPFYYVKNAHY